MDIYFEVMRTLVVVTILYMLYTVACVQHPVGIVLGKTLYVVLLCHSCFPVLVVNLAISNNFNNKDLVRSGLIEIFFVFRLLHIHPRGMIFPIQLKLAAFCLSAEQNRTSRIDWVRLVRLSSVIELTEKFQFDYVRLQKQSNNNPTDCVRLIFGSVSFDWLRRAYGIVNSGTGGSHNLCV